MTDGEIVKVLVPVVLATSGAAWAGVKTALNGTRKSIAEGRKEARDNFEAARKESRENFEALRHDVQKIDEKVGNVRERVSFLEGQRK